MPILPWSLRRYVLHQGRFSELGSFDEKLGGLLPGIILYLSTFYPRQRLQLRWQLELRLCMYIRVNADGVHQRVHRPLCRHRGVCIFRSSGRCYNEDRWPREQAGLGVAFYLGTSSTIYPPCQLVSIIHYRKDYSPSSSAEHAIYCYPTRRCHCLS